jgi:hypothetical protein
MLTGNRQPLLVTAVVLLSEPVLAAVQRFLPCLLPGCLTQHLPRQTSLYSNQCALSNHLGLHIHEHRSCHPLLVGCRCSCTVMLMVKVGISCVGFVSGSGQLFCEGIEPCRTQLQKIMDAVSQCLVTTCTDCNSICPKGAVLVTWLPHCPI